MQPPERAVAIAIHDVSPATWRECRALLALVDGLGAPPLSLLVIPDRHHRAPVWRDRTVVDALDARLARGDELVLHGFHHVDEAASPRTPRAWFERRVLTRSEGEFAALGADEAASRIARGIALFDDLGWPLHGFVAPAWLMSGGTRIALARHVDRFEYATLRGGIHHLPGWHFERTANLCYSPTSAARRALSAGIIRHELARARTTSLLRISLHPQDARVAAVLEHWRRLIGHALDERTPVTKHAWTRRFRLRAEQASAHAGAHPPVGHATASRARAAS